ncbi:MAG TPA: hypothetical protein DEF47_05035 [Herpetosiphon sp.]|uniref:hypothetical protein n=1 Tax=Herpetosiphon sp. TaxID=71864 RepID=UPI0003057845|nr:hypothetical protein [Herpetosiphon sp.]HBW49247.1 hypothetical protein [Herpetosiphon sp.]
MSFHIVIQYGTVETPLQIGQLNQDEALMIQRQLTTVARAVFADLEVQTLNCFPTYHIKELPHDPMDSHQ